MKSVTLWKSSAEFSSKLYPYWGYLFAVSAPGRVKFNEEIVMLFDSRCEVGLWEDKNPLLLSEAAAEEHQTQHK